MWLDVDDGYYGDVEKYLVNELFCFKVGVIRENIVDVLKGGEDSW